MHCFVTPERGHKWKPANPTTREGGENWISVWHLDVSVDVKYLKIVLKCTKKNFKKNPVFYHTKSSSAHVLPIIDYLYLIPRWFYINSTALGIII